MNGGIFHAPKQVSIDEKIGAMFLASGSNGTEVVQQWMTSFLETNVDGLL
jgi:hypothetical protein